MNKGYFKIRNYTIPIIPEIQYNDLMDGTPDNMSFSFTSDENLSEILNIKEKCEVEIYNSDYPLVGEIYDNRLIINNIEYNIDNENYIMLNDEFVGVINYEINELTINDTLYYIINDEIYLDNRIHYKMCISQISSEKMSTEADTGYMNTVLLNEQTVLLKDCIRTDIAISPSLYPLITETDENGEEYTYNLFDNLYDAVAKIVDCHNMCVLNDKIENLDIDLVESLKQVACPNLTYRDLSTYSQLYDVFMRIGRIPYYEDGTLYGVKLQGDEKQEIKDISKYSLLSSIKENGVNDNVYSSKTYNNLYDKESAIVPQIFEDIINEMVYFPIELYNQDLKLETQISYLTESALPGNVNFSFYDDNLINNTYRKVIRTNPDTGLPEAICYLTGVINPTATVVAEVDPTILKINEEDFVSYRLENKKYYIKLTKSNKPIFSSKEFASTSTKIIPFKDGQPDGNAITDWISEEYRKWTLLNYQDENDISKSLLFVKGYDYASKNIEDARSYSIELPFGIELVEDIYSCVPMISVEKLTDSSRIIFGWALTKYSNNRIIENTMYESLSALQKRTTAYYVRGSNKISNVVCLNITKETDDSSIWDVFKPLTSTEADYQGAFAWSMTKVYNQLRRNFFVVKYKPVIDTIYTNYDYYSEEENKPKAIKNLSLPYSQVTDKQVYPILEYNLEKGSDTTHNVKFITTDIDILNVKAGDIVLYNNNKHIVNKITTYINNMTFECNLSITDNIVQNSIISSYQDTVRVSSLLSAESVVNRPIHLFAENVIRLMDYNEEGATERNNNFDYFTQEIGSNMSIKALNRLSLAYDSDNTYTFLSKYPFRFDTILNEEKENDSPIEYYIKLSTGTSYDNENYITLRDEDFPVTLYKKSYTYVTSMPGQASGGLPIEWSNKTVSRNPAELSSNIYKYAYYRTAFLGIPVTDVSLICITSGGTTYELSAPYERTPQVSELGSPPQSNYRFYYSNQEYRTTNYGTEKMISTSGKITKVEYSFPNSSYVTNTYPGTGLSEIDIDFTSNYREYQIFDNVNIIQCTPVLFNTTKYGCKIAGFGNKEDDFYSLYALPHIFDKAYYLDLRESPRPYIQYKTLFRGSNIIEAKQLSSEIDFMVPGDKKIGSVACTFHILKIPKFLNMDNFNLDNDWQRYKITDVNVISTMNENSSAVLELENAISHSDEYDYCLLRVVPSEGLYPESRLKLLKFNIKNGYSVNKLCLRTELYAER